MPETYGWLITYWLSGECRSVITTEHPTRYLADLCRGSAVFEIYALVNFWPLTAEQYEKLEAAGGFE